VNGDGAYWPLLVRSVFPGPRGTTGRVVTRPTGMVRSLVWYLRWSGWRYVRSAQGFLSQEERIEIADLRHAGLSLQQIAHRLGRAPSTVSRELRRNATRSRGYRPFDAHRCATARRTRNHRRRIEPNSELRQVVAELLDQRWSPQQISRHLRVKFSARPGMWLCHESIYQAVYQPRSGLLRPSRLAPHRLHRCAPDEITGALNSAPSSVGRGFSSRC